MATPPAKPAATPASPATPGAKAAGPAAPASPAPAAPAKLGGRIDWKAVWPVPALVLATAGLGGALFVGILRAPKADPAAPLKTAEALFAEAKFEETVKVLNTQIAPAIEAGAITNAQARQFHLLRARSIFEGQKKLGIAHADNYAAVVRDFKVADELNPGLEPADLFMQGFSELGLGNTDRAVELAEKLPPKEQDRRLAIFEGVIDHNLKQANVKPEQTVRLLNALLEAPATTIDRRGWAIARQTELRLATGHPDEAISTLLRALPRLEIGGMNSERRAELLYLLGRSYNESGQPVQAEEQLAAARDLFSQFHPLRAEALLQIAQIKQTRGELDDARAAFVEIRKDFPTLPVAQAALLGIAETSAGLDDDETSVKSFDDLIDELSKPGAVTRRDLTTQGIAERLLKRAGERYRREDPVRALQFGQLAERALRSAKKEPGAPLLQQLAQAHRAMAAQLLRDAAGADAAHATDPDAAPKEPSLDALSPVTRGPVRRHLIDSATAWRDHARSVLLSDPAQYIVSLWNAAEDFDRAGDRVAARESFQAYIDATPATDRRRPEARFRLAQVFQAEGDLATAGSIYRTLRAGATGTDDAAAKGTENAGRWADRAIVPLARCLLRDADANNDSEAAELLTQAVSGSSLAPESTEFREALAELGELHYRQGQVAEAISRLRESLERYADNPRATVLRFKLADANRQSAQQIAADLRTSMPQSRRQELELARTQRLQDAAEGFRQVIATLNERAASTSDHANDHAGDHSSSPASAHAAAPSGDAGHAAKGGHDKPLAANAEPSLSALERLYKRNAMFYLADCAFDLNDFPGAIALYDAAAQRYSNDPASLVALTQIVAAYAKQGLWNEARTANERAKRQLAAIPDAVWNDPSLPMQRQHWERWFNSSTQLEQRAASAATP